MNKYKKAIENNETEDFLLGKGEYFVRDRDWGGHDITATYMRMINFGKENGEKTLYEQAELDYIYLLNKNLSLDDFTDIIGFIFFYFKFRYEHHQLNEDWDISKELVKKISIQYEILKRDGNDMSNIERVNNILKNDYGYTLIKDL